MHFHHYILIVLFIGCQVESDNNTTQAPVNEFFSSQKEFEDYYSSSNYYKVNNALCYSTNSLDKSIYIELICRDSSYGIVPFLISKNIFGEPIDSIDLINKPCYVGTDSHYIPNIEITKTKTIKIVDSTYSSTQSGFKTTVANNGDLVIVALGDPVLNISECIIQINNCGKFSSPQRLWKTINQSDSTKNTSIYY